MFLATTDQANELLTREPLALLIGMLLDQQIPMEKAFTSPEVLRERLGGRLDAATIANTDPDAFEEIFRRAAGAAPLPGRDGQARAGARPAARRRVRRPGRGSVGRRVVRRRS